jgi:hypothetical protein
MSFIGTRFIDSGFIGRIGSLWRSRATYGDDSLAAISPPASIVVLSASNVLTIIELVAQEAAGAVLGVQKDSEVEVANLDEPAISLAAGESGVLIDLSVSEVHDG